MDALFTGIGTVITNIISTLATVTTGLLNNELFITILGRFFFTLIILIIFKMIRYISSNYGVENIFSVARDNYYRRKLRKHGYNPAECQRIHYIYRKR